MTTRAPAVLKRYCRAQGHAISRKMAMFLFLPRLVGSWVWPGSSWLRRRRRRAILVKCDQGLMVIPSLRRNWALDNICDVLLIDTMCYCLDHHQNYSISSYTSQPPRSITRQPPQTLVNNPNLKLANLVIRLGLSRESRAWLVQNIFGLG